ncbi:MAG: FliM/FliN family flagellar motor switch protein, partial [Hungatella sp.]
MLQLQEQLQHVQAHETKMMQASPAKHTELGGGIALGKEQAENLELVMGVPLEVSVEIGRTQSLVKDILEYTKGTLVVLDKQAGDQVDLFVNGQC